MILGIDPGNELTAYCLCESGTMKPIKFDKISNQSLIDELLPSLENETIAVIAIEHMQGYGMGVGREVFETCYYIGRLLERIERTMPNVTIQPIYRTEEKVAICGHLKGSNDMLVRHNLIDKFAQHDFKTGKGVKKNPDFFYGFKSDCWSAFAIAYTAQLKLEGKI
jgi:hypothetical protein